MELKYKPDFDRTLERFEAWWQRQIIDRPPVTLAVKPAKPPRAVPEKTHASLRERWFDVEHALDKAEAVFEATAYLGDAFPSFLPNLGPNLAATVFGCELEFGEVTSFPKAAVSSCRDIPAIQPNLDNPYWNAIRKATDLSLERGAGKWITALPELRTNGDIPGALRQQQELCMELMDEPSSVRLAVEHVTRAFPLMFEDLWNRIAAKGQPSTTWTPCLHAGKSYVTNADFICMISPELFQEAILPSIVSEMNYLERNMFHMDGIPALRHLDAILAQPKVNGLQWVFGTGRGPAAKWIDVYKRIQAAGKCLQILADDMDDAMLVAEHLRPEGVWFSIGGAHTSEEAQNILNRITAWAAKK